MHAKNVQLLFSLDLKRKNHKTTVFNVFWSKYILKILPASVLVKFGVFSDTQEH